MIKKFILYFIIIIILVSVLTTSALDIRYITMHDKHSLNDKGIIINDPIITTLPATGITYYSATLNGFVSNSSGSISVSFVYGTDSYRLWYSSDSQYVSNGKFSATIFNLNLKSDYYFQAVSYYGDGDLLQFTTCAKPPDVETVGYSDLSHNSVKLKGHLHNIGGEDSCDVMFVYGKFKNMLDYHSDNKILTSSGEYNILLDNLQENTKYYYQAFAHHNGCYGYNTDYGDIKNFSTLRENNYPPNSPRISGESKGKNGTEYTYYFETTDPDYDDVFYYIEWGDNQIENWIGPFKSGESISINHTWHVQGNYTLRAKSKDAYNEESDWTTFEVIMPRNLKYFPIFYNLKLLLFLFSFTD